jgi:hypothetical protein
MCHFNGARQPMGAATEYAPCALLGHEKATSQWVREKSRPSAPANLTPRYLRATAPLSSGGTRERLLPRRLRRSSTQRDSGAAILSRIISLLINDLYLPRIHDEEVLLAAVCDALERARGEVKRIIDSRVGSDVRTVTYAKLGSMTGSRCIADARRKQY